MKKPIYSVNIDFFKTWSYDMAYILGFFSGDGCLRKNECGTWVFIISIHTKDIEILNYVKQIINSTHPITFSETIHKSGIKTPKSTLKITSNKFCKPLLKLGLCQRKTWNKKLPKIPNEFKADYLRGYFDADGSLSIKNRPSKTKNYIWRISCCCKNFLIDMQNNIYPTLGKIVKGNKSFDWEINKRDDIFEICQFMYNNNFALKRKKDRYLNMPINQHSIKYEAFGEYKTGKEWSKDARCKVSYFTFEKRLSCGWTMEKTLLTPNLRPRKAIKKS